MIGSTLVTSRLFTWGVGAHRFQVRSEDPRVLERVAIVFRPWTRPASSPAAVVWGVTADQAGDEWTMVRDGLERSETVAPRTRACAALEFQALQPLLEGHTDLLTVHAALVARQGRGLLIVGRGESGKSTLACALWRHGYSLLGDDVAMIDVGTWSAEPAPRRVSVRAPSRALLGDDLWAKIVDAPATDPSPEGYKFHPDEIDGIPRLPSVPVDAVVFLARAGAAAGSAAVSHLDRAHAALAFLPYTNHIRVRDAGHVIATAAHLFGAARAFDLRRAPLPEMVAAIDRILDEVT